MKLTPLFLPPPSTSALAKARLPLIASLVCLLAGTAPAQSDNSERSFGPWVWGVSGGAVHQFEADLDDSAGAFSVSRYFAGASLGYAAGRYNSASLSIGVGESRYDFSGSASIEGRQPWDNIREYSLSAPLRYSPNERANIIVIPGVRTHIEEGGSLDDGRTEGLIAAAGWKFSDALTLGPGFGWYSELGGGSNFFPIVLIDWSITERISLSTGRGMAASQGPGLSLDYSLDNHWKMGLTARYEKNRFALDQDAASAGAYGEDTGVPLLLTAQYSPWPMTRISAVAGIELGGALKLEDGRGRTIAKSDFDNAAIFGLVFSSRF